MAKRTFLQEQQIALGEEHGLLKEEIRLYRSPRFNYLQMEQIRLGFEQGLGEKEIRKYAHVWIPHEKMEEMREKLKEGDREAVPAVLPGGFTVREAAVMLGILVAGGLAAWSFGFRMFGCRAELHLRTEEAVLECGEVFLPQSYVGEYQGSEDAELYCPNGIMTLVPQEYALVYRLVSGNQLVEKILRLRVEDHTPPSLVLKQKEVYRKESDVFSCMAYVEQAYDDVSGDLYSEVQCQNRLEPGVEQQDILYRLQDHAGNFTTAVLTVFHEAEQPPENQEETAGETE